MMSQPNNPAFNNDVTLFLPPKLLQQTLQPSISLSLVASPRRSVIQPAMMLIMYDVTLQLIQLTVLTVAFLRMSSSPKGQGRKLARGDDKYDRISHKQKILLIKQVIYDKGGIKQASDALNLNYSTAKTLIRRFKTRGCKLNKDFIVGCTRWFEVYEKGELKRSGFQCIEGGEKVEGCENSASTVQNGLGSEHSMEEGSLPAFDLKSGQVTIIQQVLFTE